MLIWVAFAILTAVAIGLIARPLIRPVAEAAAADSEATLNIYRDQLTEIGRERARGLIGDAEAEAARAEIARRLIARAEGMGDGEGGRVSGRLASDRTRVSARGGLVALALVPLVAIGLYLTIGSPLVASLPLAERLAVRPDKAPIEELVARVEARLAENPDEGAGWDAIAPIYLRIGRYDDAVAAFVNAIRLQGETMQRLSGLAEASVAGAQGVVPDVARKAYARIVAREPGRLDARFWLAVADEQDGKTDAARTAYIAILQESPADAPWRTHVEERLAAVGGASPPAASPGSLPQSPAGAQSPPITGEGGAPQPGPGPSQDDMASAARMSPAEREQMIRSMVDGLATRLAENGADAGGWQRLLRAYIVLGEKDKAAAALSGARRALAGDQAGLDAVEVTARQLGLGS